MRKFDLNEPSLFMPDVIPFPDVTGKIVLLLPSAIEVAIFSKIFGFREEDAKKLFCANVIIGTSDYPNLMMCGNFMGASLAVALLEVLAGKGARHFIFCGQCGSLNPKMGIGTVFMAEAAASDEGASVNYSHDDVFKPDQELTRTLKAVLNSRDQVFARGTMVSTDAVFRETKSKIDFFKANNYLALDMETSALYAAARFLNVRLCSLYVISDVFYDDKWMAGVGSREFKQGSREAAQVVKEMVIWMTEYLKA